MESQTQSSELTNCTTIYSQKAWHLVTLLLSLGRPAFPAELAAKCSLFKSSREFVEFLCSIPNSPLFLTHNGFVTLSMAALVAFGEFIANSMPTVEIMLNEARELIEGGCARIYFSKRRRLSDGVLPLVKKRLHFPADIDNEEGTRMFSSINRDENILLAAHDDTSAQMQWFMNALPFHSLITPFTWGIRSDAVALTPFTADCYVRLSESQLQFVQEQVVESKLNTSAVAQEQKHIDKSDSQCSHISDDKLCKANNVMPCKLYLEPALSSQAKNVMLLDEPRLDMPDMINRKCGNRKKKLEDRIMLDCGSPRENIDLNCSSGALYDWRIMNFKTEDKLDCKELKKAQGKGMLLPSPCDQASAEKISAVSPAELKNVLGDAMTPRSQVLLKGLQHLETDGLHKEKQKGIQNSISRKYKSKLTGQNDVLIRQKGENTHRASSKDDLELRALPTFESYVVEEEEGSGGYGTVYRARRKSDGTTFAIKYPHPNAHKHHVNNERRMLERFGGKNFVIKYEGSFKSGNFDCFVLEYVEHVRPEVLKREMDIISLMWYAYCMFRALASLHKQGVVHRDVKPGNFLFSCKTCKGYLIDFNLAKDLHQKPGNMGKSKSNVATSFLHIPASHMKAGSASKPRSGKFSDALKGGSAKGSKPTLERRMLKQKADGKVKAQIDLGCWNSLTSQGADGSGLTSAKDATSGRTPVERLKEPLPCQGRRELISLAHEAMQSMNQEAASAPALKRKRVAAPPGIVNTKRVYFTPMPLHSSGIAIPGSGLLKKRGEEKPQKEGPCVGTKGFRAPEVLLRSAHQGPKVDLWSAGVTLLYLITGRMPFTGEPEQNMREIVKIRGSEDLWEVAKLHNRECSFPADLFDARFLPSMKLQDWCELNTKRPKFLEGMPGSLYDLVDRCLTVNPRLRISAEEALRHEFFAPCHEAFQRLRSRKQVPTLDSMGSYNDERRSSECS